MKKNEKLESFREELEKDYKQVTKDIETANQELEKLYRSRTDSESNV